MLVLHSHFSFDLVESGVVGGGVEVVSLSGLIIAELISGASGTASVSFSPSIAGVIPCTRLIQPPNISHIESVVLAV